jgi:hypothetical protein
VKVARTSEAEDHNRRDWSSAPRGQRISYSQLKQPCDLRLRFKREHVPDKDRSIFFTYGSAFHAGIEAFLTGAATTTDQAVEAALDYVSKELLDPKRKKQPLRFDEPHTLRKDGEADADTYSNLPSIDFVRYWLRLQVPRWVWTHGEIRARKAEGGLYIPITGVTGNWWLECWLDFEIDDAAHGIVDIKTTASPWKEQDLKKNAEQAHVYMGAYHAHYGVEPGYFDFHVIDRSRNWDITVHRVLYDVAHVNRYIKGVIRPRITGINAGSFPANPVGWHCSERFCGQWNHCAFGSGTHL